MNTDHLQPAYKDKGFSLWIEGSKTIRLDKGWTLTLSGHAYNIYDERFFLPGFTIHEYEDEGELVKVQKVIFNQKLFQQITDAVLAKRGLGKGHSVQVTDREAGDFDTACHHAGWSHAVHLISRSPDFFRWEVTGSQEQIWNKVIDLLKWMSEKADGVKEESKE